MSALGLEESEATRLVEHAASLWRVSPDSIWGKSRNMNSAEARSAVIWVMRSRGMSFPAIGRAFNRDHSTVFVAHRKFCARMRADSAVREAAELLVSTELDVARASLTAALADVRTQKQRLDAAERRILEALDLISPHQRVVQGGTRSVTVDDLNGPSKSRSTVHTGHGAAEVASGQGAAA